MTTAILITSIMFLIGFTFACSTADASSTRFRIRKLMPHWRKSKANRRRYCGRLLLGVEAVFEHVKGVSDAKSGYAGGDAASADYRKVSSGTTGHAESVLVTYDPSQIMDNY